ncbi:hypothetical protein JI743_13585 [Sphingopyxis sp. DHUNG17]|uniref:hypothetical protein n=1 Tax=Sphingopyxis jiangsuensis TaxID=2871171 RepID=UPI00191E3EA7|nr:hypothetical protein [Sphingopyxis lutea]MBL0769837.1 hypothetical protein [Sphingopyxis lutea]
MKIAMSRKETTSQLEKFKEAARDLETDDDPERFDERLGRMVKQKPTKKGKAD